MADAMAGLRRASPGATEALGPGGTQDSGLSDTDRSSGTSDLQRVYANTKKHSGAGFHCRVRSTRFRRLIVRSARGTWGILYMICIGYRHVRCSLVSRLSFNLIGTCSTFTTRHAHAHASPIHPRPPFMTPVTAVVNAENTDTSLLIKTKQSKHASRCHTHR